MPQHHSVLYHYPNILYSNAVKNQPCPTRTRHTVSCDIQSERTSRGNVELLIRNQSVEPRSLMSPHQAQMGGVGGGAVVLKY